MDELQKWIDLARTNLSDNKFHVWLNSTKAFNGFQNSNSPLDAASYRAQVAITNALLMSYLDLSDNKILNEKKVTYLIQCFDKLVMKATFIEEASNLHKFDALAKCLLYMRIGDYIIGLTQTTSLGLLSKIPKHIHALYCYCLAYEWAYQGWIENQEDPDPLLALCIAELHILMMNNLNEASDKKNALSNCNGHFLNCFIYSARQYDENNSFLLVDKTIVRRKLHNLDLEQALIKAWPIRENMYFLRRIVWIFAKSPGIERSNYNFLNGILDSLPEHPRDPDDAFTPETLSIIDIKIFFFRLSRHLKCTLSVDGFLPQWLFFQKPIWSQQTFWEALNELLTRQGDTKNLNLQTLMNIQTALEQIRVPHVSSTDVESIIETKNFITRLRNSMTATDETRDFCDHLARTYSEAIKAEAIPESDWVLVLEESDRTCDSVHSANELPANEFIAYEDEQTPPKGNNTDEQIVPENASTVAPILASNSTQTDSQIVDEKPLQNWAIAQDWGEVNFNIGRWIQHNHTLQKLFISPN